MQNKKILQCPFCSKRIGDSISTDVNSYQIIHKVKPLATKTSKAQLFETKCDRCKKMLIIEIGFTN